MANKTKTKFVLKSDALKFVVFSRLRKTIELDTVDSPLINNAVDGEHQVR